MVSHERYLMLPRPQVWWHLFTYRVGRPLGLRQNTSLTMCAAWRTLKFVSYQVLKTEEFEEWLDEQQPQLRTIVLARLDHVAIGHFGNHKRFEGLIELK